MLALSLLQLNHSQLNYTIKCFRHAKPVVLFQVPPVYCPQPNEIECMKGALELTRISCWVPERWGLSLGEGKSDPPEESGRSSSSGSDHPSSLYVALR